MVWLEVSVVTDGEGAEAVSEVLRPFAYNDGVVLEQLGDESTADPDALETAVTVKIYLPEEEDTPQLRRRLEEIIYHMGRLYPLPPPTFRQLQEKDWANAWKSHYKPFRIGRGIWIQPSWLDIDEPVQDNAVQPDDIVLVLDPGMAFGTGLHPTTQMCLQALETLVQDGDSVFDVGTGSGILAIAAEKLGATQLLGIDNDAVAVRTAVANAELNQIEHTTWQQATLDQIDKKDWDIVVVNILAHVIVSLLEQDDLLSYVFRDGHLILSGIVEEQGATVVTAVTAAGGKVEKTYQIRDWISFVVSRS